MAFAFESVAYVNGTSAVKFEERTRLRLVGRSNGVIVHDHPSRTVAAPHAMSFKETLAWRRAEAFGRRASDIDGAAVLSDPHTMRTLGLGIALSTLALLAAIVLPVIL